MGEKEIKDSIVRTVSAMSPLQVILILIFVGIFLGGGSHSLIDNFLTANTVQMSETVTELNQSIRTLNRSLDEQTDLLIRTRCEIRALREDTDWRNCWAPLPQLDLPPGQ